MTTKKKRSRTEWERLPEKQQDKLADEFIFRVLSGRPVKRLGRKIAKLKGIDPKEVGY